MNRLSLCRLPVVAVTVSFAGCFPVPGTYPVRDGGTSDAAQPPVTDASVQSDGSVTQDGGADAGELDAGPSGFSLDGAVASVLAPTGGRINALASSAASEVLYAIGDEHGALFRSDNEGSSFVRVPLPALLHRPVVGAPLDSPDVVVVADGLGTGAWRSTNRGDDWEPVPSLRGVAVLRLIAEPSNPSWLYATAGEEPLALVLDGGTAAARGLWLSTDQGQTFSQVAFSAETVHDVIYADGYHVAATERGLLRAITNGSPSSLTSELATRAVVADPAVAGAFLLLTADRRLLRVQSSTEPIVTLGSEPIAGGLMTRGTEVLLLTSDGIYRGTPAAPVTLPDGGSPDAGPAANRPITSVTRILNFENETVPSSFVRLRGGTQGVAIAWLGDGVRTALGAPHGSLVWQAAATGIRSAQRCPSLAASTTRTLAGCVVEFVFGPEGRIFSGSEPDVLSVETELGIPAVLPTSGGPVAVAIGPDGTRYAAVGTLYAQSARAGAWDEVSVEDVFFVAAHPRRAGKLVTGVMRLDGLPQVYVSSNGGEILDGVPGTRGLAPAQAVFHPTNDVVAYLVGAQGLDWRIDTGVDLERGLFRTTDAFATLVSWGPALPAGEAVASIAVASTSPLLLVAVTDAGNVWRTLDEGTTWTQAGAIAGLMVTSMTALPGRSGVLFAAGVPASGGSARAVHLSVDNGSTWSPVALDVPATLTVVPDPTTPAAVLLGTAGQGVWSLREAR